MMAHSARQRYADIFRDVEKLIDDHSKLAAQLSLPTSFPNTSQSFTREPERDQS